MTDTRKLYVLWALPRGATDRAEERPLTSFPLTYAEALRVISKARADGWHGFQLARESGGAPDFARAAYTRGSARKHVS